LLAGLASRVRAAKTDKLIFVAGQHTPSARLTWTVNAFTTGRSGNQCRDATVTVIYTGDLERSDEKSAPPLLEMNMNQCALTSIATT